MRVLEKSSARHPDRKCPLFYLKRHEVRIIGYSCEREGQFSGGVIVGTRRGRQRGLQRRLDGCRQRGKSRVTSRGDNYFCIRVGVGVSQVKDVVRLIDAVP